MADHDTTATDGRQAPRQRPCREPDPQLNVGTAPRAACGRSDAPQHCCAARGSHPEARGGSATRERARCPLDRSRSPMARWSRWHAALGQAIRADCLRARSSNSAQVRFRPGSGALPTLTRVGDYDGPASSRGPGRAAGASRPPLRRRGGVGSAAPQSPPGRRGGRPPLSAATRRPDRAPFPGRADQTPTSTVLHPRDLPTPGSSPGTCGALRMSRPRGCIILA